MVEHEHGARQHEAGVGLFLREAGFQLLVEEPGDAVAEIPVQGAGDGRQFDAFGAFEVQAVHQGAQAVHEGPSGKRGEGREPFVVRFKG